MNVDPIPRWTLFPAVVKYGGQVSPAQALNAIGQMAQRVVGPISNALYRNQTLVNRAGGYTSGFVTPGPTSSIDSIGGALAREIANELIKQ